MLDRNGITGGYHSTGRWVSSKHLTIQEERVLAKGLNFAPASNRIPIADIVTSVEDGLRKVRSDQIPVASIVDVLKKAKTPVPNLSPSA